MQKILYAIEGTEILEKKTKKHSKTSCKVYLPVDWEKVVIINISSKERKEDDR